MSLNDIYLKQYEQQKIDQEKVNTKLLMEQLKQENETRVEFKQKNYHRQKYHNVKTTYSVIYGTQTRFELLLKIVQQQQKQIERLERA